MSLQQRVFCSCGWRGYRGATLECACYDEWAMACRPWSPGPGCGAAWARCPRCGKMPMPVYNKGQYAYRQRRAKETTP